MISPQPIAVNKIVPIRKARIPTKVDPSKVPIAAHNPCNSGHPSSSPLVIPTRERSETGGIRCSPAAHQPWVPHFSRPLREVGLTTATRIGISIPKPANQPTPQPFVIPDAQAPHPLSFRRASERDRRNPLSVSSESAAGASLDCSQ
jgi:hypothetical protein